MTPWEAIRNLSGIFFEDVIDRNLYLCNLIARTILGLSPREYTDRILAHYDIKIEWENADES